ncbi:ABC transporter permease [Paradesulfitobacterium ferrireducens]|uniref:ABC transporter permease n=1 Tax=Paradesulfitobacterium ferrireducens TaxID=2816476 RepID=UPI001A8DF5BB|nr:ABC transporter permease [Paradesulfitobacterium ferrireducens]
MKLQFGKGSFKNVAVALLAIVFGLLAGAVLITLTGSDPLAGYAYLFKGGLMSLERFGDTLATSTPLILSGLSVAFAFKTGLFNIGAAGQMLMGGFCATAVGLTLDLPSVMILPLAIMASIVGGAVWAFIPGILKARFNVHEVVSTIMMNWIGYWVVYYAVPGYFKGEFLETESRAIPDAASLKVGWLSQLFNGSFINLGLFLAIAAVVLIAFILNKTVIGYELKAVGYNRFAAEYAGINVNRNIVLSMMIAGALAGLGGATLYIGNASNIQIGVLPAQGFDGIAVALLGANSPWGSLLAALFFGLLYSGKGFMNAMIQIPPEIADTIIATIIYFAATSVLIERLLKRLRSRKRGQ